MAALTPFPAPAGEPPGAPAALRARGIRLRPACELDLPGLRELYGETRADEMARAPWPPALKQAFLDQQFALQHEHYVAHFAGTDFLVLEAGATLVGRYYLRRSAPEHLVVDLSLSGAWRGQGLGRALLEAAQAEAAALGRGVALSVAHANPAARRLYLRLGFEPVGRNDSHERLAWRPSVS